MRVLQCHRRQMARDNGQLVGRPGVENAEEHCRDPIPTCGATMQIAAARVACGNITVKKSGSLQRKIFLWDAQMSWDLRLGQPEPGSGGKVKKYQKIKILDFAETNKKIEKK